ECRRNALCAEDIGGQICSLAFPGHLSAPCFGCHEWIACHDLTRGALPITEQQPSPRGNVPMQYAAAVQLGGEIDGALGVETDRRGRRSDYSCRADGDERGLASQPRWLTRCPLVLHRAADGRRLR